MKLLYTVILLLSIKQWVFTAPLEENNQATPREQLMEFYGQEFKALTKEIPEKLEKITESLLNKETVKNAKTPLLLEFKNNLTNFQNRLPLFNRYHWHKNPQLSFANMMQRFVEPLANDDNEKDLLDIQQMVKESGYFELREEYKTVLKQFIKQKFLPKFNEIKNKITDESISKDFVQNCTKFIEKLQQCEQYECFLTSLEDTLFTPKEQFLSNINSAYGPFQMLAYYNISLFVTKALEDLKLLQLDSSNIKQQIIKNFEEFMEKYEDTEEVYDLNFSSSLLGDLSQSITMLSDKDISLMFEIFENHNFKQSILDLEMNFNRLFENIFLKELEHFISSLKKEESTKNEAWLKLYERSKQANTFQQRYEIIYEFVALSEIDEELEAKILFN